MKIAVVGAGPAGLLFAGLAKRSHPHWQVTLYEREKVGTTYGHGVVLPGRNQSALAARVPDIFERIRVVSVPWSDLEVRHKGARLRCANSRFVGVRRARLLQQLHAVAVEAGVDLRYETESKDPRALAEDVDLLVAADGARSRTRSAWPGAFGAEVGEAKEAFLWLSVPQSFPCLTFPFERARDAGWMGVHAYPHGEGESTFIIEAPIAVARRLQAMEDEGVGPTSPLVHLFDDHLDAPLDLRTAQWHSFTNVRCDRWHHENVALIGDSAHTAHFSIGSGTGLAFGDALALNDAISERPLHEALPAYDAARRPAVDEFSQISRISQRWWEELDLFGELPPDEFVAHFWTRVPVVNRGGLQMLDGSFVASLERRRREEHGGELPRDWAGEIAGVRISGRLLGDSETVRRLGAAERQGLGLVVREVNGDLRDATRAAAGGDASDSAPVSGTVVTLDGTDEASVAPLVDAARDAGPRHLLFVRLREPSERVLQALGAGWRTADRRALVPVFEAGDAAEEWASLATRLGAPAVGFWGAPEDLDRVVRCAERVRASTGVPVLLDLPLADARVADTLIMSGRADYCRLRLR